MKFAIDPGHNAPPDIGARGIIQEDILTKQVGTRVINSLQTLGHEVINCLPNRASSVIDSLNQRCQIANSNNVDIYVSIHFNEFDGTANGTEVYAASDTGKKIAQPVLESIVDLGFYYRGVKDGSHLYVLRNTQMPAILIECCFCDSQVDMNRFKADAMAEAIVKGLVKKSSPSSDSGQNLSILKLQQSLNRLKITDQNNQPLLEDGIIGASTNTAKKKLQAILGLSENEITDTTLWNVINQIFAKPILRGNHAGGPVVRYIQSRVNTTITGLYGPDTVNAVRLFQLQNGLTTDGIVGLQTWGKLIG